jgi:hypothetical protein
MSVLSLLIFLPHRDRQPIHIMSKIYYSSNVCMYIYIMIYVYNYIYIMMNIYNCQPFLRGGPLLVIYILVIYIYNTDVILHIY